LTTERTNRKLCDVGKKKGAKKSQRKRCERGEKHQRRKTHHPQVLDEKFGRARLRKRRAAIPRKKNVEKKKAGKTGRGQGGGGGKQHGDFRNG